MNFSMFDSPYTIVKIIAIAAAVVYIIFRFQVVLLAVKTFFDRGNKMDDKISDKVDEYLEKYNSKIHGDNPSKD